MKDFQFSVTTSLAMNREDAGALVGIKGKYTGSIIRIQNNQEIIIGRDETCCNLVLLSKAVSRKHCSVIYNMLRDEYYVTDYSSNGTYLMDGRRLEQGKARVMKRGEDIYIGNNEIQFRLG